MTPTLELCSLSVVTCWTLLIIVCLPNLVACAGKGVEKGGSGADFLVTSSDEDENNMANKPAALSKSDDLVSKMKLIEQTFDGQDLAACQEWLRMHKLLSSEEKKLLTKNRQFRSKCKTILAAYRLSGRQLKHLAELISNDAYDADDDDESNEINSSNKNNNDLLANQMIDLIKTLQVIEETTSLFADRRAQFELQIEQNANLKRLMEAIWSFASGYACDTPNSMITNKLNGDQVDSQSDLKESNVINTMELTTRPEVKTRLLELDNQLRALMVDETSLLGDPRLVEKFIELYGEMEPLLENEWHDKTVQSGLFNSFAGTIHGALSILSRAGNEDGNKI